MFHIKPNRRIRLIGLSKNDRFTFNAMVTALQGFKNPSPDYPMVLFRAGDNGFTGLAGIKNEFSSC